MATTKRVNKRKQIHVIDQGTRYDIVEQLTQLTSRIKSGEMGDVRDVVIGLRRLGNGGVVGVHARHFGKGTIVDAYHTLEMMRDSWA